MVASTGWFADWWQSGQFPPVWFAPGDESAVPPEELRPPGGGEVTAKKKPPKSKRPAWVIPPQFIKPKDPQPVEEDEAYFFATM